MTKQRKTTKTTRTTATRKRRSSSTSSNGSRPDRREIATERLTGLATTANADEERATKSRHRMYAGMLKAHRAGLTYEEIAAITGKSRIRVSQILSAQRAK